MFILSYISSPCQVVGENKFVWRNCNLSGTPRRCLLGVSPKPFQRLVGAAAIGGRASQGAKHPFRRVLFFQAFFFAPLVSKKKADYRFRYVMLVYLSTQSNSYSLIRFFFWQKKRKRKSLAKRKARIRDFASAEATNAPRVGSAVAFGKATQNLFKQTTPWRHR